jgi:3-deoxy-D-manno-octulosonate 8-phosphate phosphatase (KDO 8-P phosphatase)
MMKKISKILENKIRKVTFLLLDVDGVLTDGRIIYDSNGYDSKFFDVHDGLGVYLLGRMGIKTILITAKNSKSIKPRAKDMRVEAVYGNILPKTRVYKKVLKVYDLKDEEVCFVGDDLVDLCVLKRVGFPVATNNAASEIKQCALYTTQKDGGRGAVREVAELILKTKGLWAKALKTYLS